MYNFEDLKYITYKRFTDSSSNFFPWSYFFKEGFILDKKGKEIIKEVLNGTNKGLYIHIPFCVTKCSYCVYIRKTPDNKEELDKYIDYILKELKLYLDLSRLERLEFDTIMFGGGTPSIFNSEQLEKLFEGLKKYVYIEKAEQISFESSPYTLSKDKVDILLKNGVSRISIGIQSFDEKVLKVNNRPYMSFEKINDLIQYIKEKGINVHIDLMSGIKGQNLQSCIEDYKKFKQLGINNFTMNYFYSGKTSQYKDSIESIKLKKQAKKFYQNINMDKSKVFELLQERKMTQYPIYNILGLGVGAVSSFLESITFRKKEFDLYYKLLDEGKIPIETGIFLEGKYKSIRYFLNNIGQGVSIEEINKIYNIDFINDFKEEIDIFLSKKIIFIKERIIFLQGNVYIAQIYFSLFFLKVGNFDRLILNRKDEEEKRNIDLHILGYMAEI